MRPHGDPRRRWNTGAANDHDSQQVRGQATVSGTPAVGVINNGQGGPHHRLEPVGHMMPVIPPVSRRRRRSARRALRRRAAYMAERLAATWALYRMGRS